MCLLVLCTFLKVTMGALSCTSLLITSARNPSPNQDLTEFWTLATSCSNLVLPHTSTEYRDVFLLVYRAYVTPEELLERLLYCASPSDCILFCPNDPAVFSTRVGRVELDPMRSFL